MAKLFLKLSRRIVQHHERVSSLDFAAWFEGTRRRILYAFFRKVQRQRLHGCCKGPPLYAAPLRLTPVYPVTPDMERMRSRRYRQVLHGKDFARDITMHPFHIQGPPTRHTLSTTTVPPRPLERLYSTGACWRCRRCRHQLRETKSHFSNASQ